MKVELCKMYMDEEIKKAALDVLDSGIYINGPQVKAFEKEFADYIGVKKAVTVNSGTSALFIAFMDIGLHPGDEIIVPSHTFFSSASQAIHLGAKPVFVEVDPTTYTMDVEHIRKKITPKTRAIVAVHIYGNPVDLDPILELARENNIIVIEDCAQAHGTKYKGKLVGSIGDYGCFSFFPSKIMNVGGDGGMITTNNEESAARLGMLKNHGRKGKYSHEIFGMNMRMPEIPAAIGRVQLKKLNFFIQKRKEIMKYYDQHLGNCSFLQLPVIPSYADSVFYVYTVQLDKRDEFEKYLSDNGIASGIYYPIPLHLQPIIMEKFGKDSLPITEKICKRIISIPLSPMLTKQELDYVVEKIKAFKP